VLDFTAFADLLLRGAESARRDARRIVDELRERGDLSAEEADALEEAVGRAASAGPGLLFDALASPLRRALSMLRVLGNPGEDVASAGAEVDERFASLDARIAELEARLHAAVAPRNE